MRLAAHIFTDKVIYRPNDVIFAEVLVLDAFLLSPVALNQTEYFNYYISFDIIDSQGITIASNSDYVINTTATFTYKVPADIVGGEYTLKTNSYSNVAPAMRLIRIRDYPRDVIRIESNLPYESYRPGDTVSGNIKVSTVDGTPLDEHASFSLDVNFNTVNADGSEKNVETSQLNLPLSKLGEAVFTFVIPSNTNMLLTTISLTVTNLGTT